MAVSASSFKTAKKLVVGLFINYIMYSMSTPDTIAVEAV